MEVAVARHLSVCGVRVGSTKPATFRNASLDAKRQAMMRAVAVYVGRAVRGAEHARHYRCGGRKRPKSSSAARRPVGRVR